MDDTIWSSYEDYRRARQDAEWQRMLGRSGGGGVPPVDPTTGHPMPPSVRAIPSGPGAGEFARPVRMQRLPLSDLPNVPETAAAVARVAPQVVTGAVKGAVDVPHDFASAAEDLVNWALGTGLQVADAVPHFAQSEGGVEDAVRSTVAFLLPFATGAGAAAKVARAARLAPAAAKILSRAAGAGLAGFTTQHGALWPWAVTMGKAVLPAQAAQDLEASAAALPEPVRQGFAWLLDNNPDDPAIARRFRAMMQGVVGASVANGLL